MLSFDSTLHLNVDTVIDLENSVIQYHLFGSWTIHIDIFVDLVIEDNAVIDLDLDGQRAQADQDGPVQRMP